MTDFDTQYLQILSDIMTNGHNTPSRDNHEVRGLPGITMKFDLEKGFPILTLRKIPLKIFVAEMIWFIMGSDNPDDFVSQYTKIWHEFMQDGPHIKRAPAYGHRWRHHFKRDQLQGLVDHLTESKYSRHGVVVTWDPADDGLGEYGTLKYNIPCPYTFTVNIMNDRLHLHNIIRSNDMMLGNPHDVAGFALLAYILAAKLNVKPGFLTTSISNAHVWDGQYQAAEELLNRDFSNHKHEEIKFEAKPDYYERASQGDHSLVTEILEILKSQYTPLKRIKMKAIVGYENK